MTKIITLAGQKGGAGKSTIAVHLAAAWMSEGRRVLLIDADPQGTTITWAEVAAEEHHKAPTVVAMGDQLRASVPALARDFDLVVIDTQGRESRRLVQALALADLAILPCGPGTADVWALEQSLRTVQEVQDVRDGLQAVIALNQTSHRTLIGQGLRETVESAGVGILSAELGSRVAYAEAMAAGQGVTVYAPKSKAAAEMRALAAEIAKLVGLRAKRGARGH